MSAKHLSALLIACLCVGCASRSDLMMAARESGLTAGREALQRDWRMQTYDAEVMHIVDNPPHPLSSSGYHTVVYRLQLFGSTTQTIDYVEGTGIGNPRLKVGDKVTIKMAVEKTANN